MSKIAVGIDLGTSNTVVSVVHGNKAHVIPDREGRKIHPSVVSMHPKGDILVGQEALRRRVIDPTNTVYSVKRLIGRQFRHEAVQTAVRKAPYRIEMGENEQPMVFSRGKEYTVPEISAYVLRHVKGLAEQYLGQDVEHAVITVPANFNDAQREATKAAGRIAGLNVLRILNEPTAAALAYGYGQGLNTTLAVYDYGGGTFDTTILKLADRVFEVLSTAGDSFLGGDDIDEKLVEYMCQLFLRQTRIDLAGNVSALARLRQVGEQVKRPLSQRPKAQVQVQQVAFGPGGQPLDLAFALTRERLNAMAKEEVQRTFLICDEALGLANIDVTLVDEVVLVGGSTKMPMVRENVEGYFGRPARSDINPDEVVAVGAAIQAAALLRMPGMDTPGVDSVLLDVTPRALGIAVVGGYSEVIIDRNAQIPVEQTRRFVTSQDHQTQVRIQVCQGEGRKFDENQALGELVLDGLPPAPRGEVQVEVTFEIDTDGILQVSAQDLETGQAQQAEIHVLGAPSQEQTEALIDKHANDLPGPAPE